MAWQSQFGVQTKHVAKMAHTSKIAIISTGACLLNQQPAKLGVYIRRGARFVERFKLHVKSLRADFVYNNDKLTSGCYKPRISFQYSLIVSHWR